MVVSYRKENYSDVQVCTGRAFVWLSKKITRFYREKDLTRRCVPWHGPAKTKQIICSCFYGWQVRQRCAAHESLMNVKSNRYERRLTLVFGHRSSSSKHSVFLRRRLRHFLDSNWMFDVSINAKWQCELESKTNNLSSILHPSDTPVPSTIDFEWRTRRHDMTTILSQRTAIYVIVCPSRRIRYSSY